MAEGRRGLTSEAAEGHRGLASEAAEVAEGHRGLLAERQRDREVVAVAAAHHLDLEVVAVVVGLPGVRALNYRHQREMKGQRVGGEVGLLAPCSVELVLERGTNRMHQAPVELAAAWLRPAICPSAALEGRAESAVAEAARPKRPPGCQGVVAAPSRAEAEEEVVLHQLPTQRPDFPRKQGRTFWLVH